MSKDILDKLFESLDSFEHGMATRSIKSRKGVVDGLDAISNQVVAVLNRGTSFRPGVKSVLLRIQRLVSETTKGVAEGIYENLTEIRQLSANKLGPLNTLLRNQNAGVKASATQKEQAREYEKDEDTQEEIHYLSDTFDPGNPNINGHKYEGQDIYDTVASFLHYNFSKSQLGSIVTAVKEYRHHVEQKGKTPIDSNLKEIGEYWNALSLKDILAASPKSAEMREIVQALTKSHDDDLKDLAESYKSLQSRLPAKIHNGPFTALYYPVVPIFKDFDASRSPAKLERAGFTVSKIGSHFMVLENQLLVAIDITRLESHFVTGEDGKKKTVNKGSKNKNEYAHYLMSILDSINERFPKKYALASYHVVPNPKNPNIGFAWLISEHARKALTQSLHTTELKWDIPRYDIRATKLSNREAPAHRFTTRTMPDYFR